LHHEAQKAALTQNEQTLISDEKAFLSQADLKKAFGSTRFERKQMSTKTTLKRIALVAVSALGLGIMSGVAAKAAATTVYVSPIALTAPTAPVTGTSFSVTAKGTVTMANTDTARLKAYWISKPAGASTLLGATAGAVSGNFTPSVETAGPAPLVSLLGTAGGAVSGKKTFGTFDYTATKAGSYTLRVWDDFNDDGAVSIGEDSTDITFTVSAANTTPSAGYSTLKDAGAVKVTGFAAAAYTKALGTTTDTLTVAVKNTANANLDDTAIRAVVSGPGTVTLTATGGAAVSGRDVTSVNSGGNDATFSLASDGVAGKSTVTIYSGTTKLFTTDAIYWYGDVAKLTVTQNLTIVGKAGGALGALGGDAYGVEFSAVDADGNVVYLDPAGFAGTSSDTLVLNSSALGGADFEQNANTGSDGTGVGAIVHSSAASVSGQSATMTYSYTYTNLAGDATTVKATPVTVKVAGAAKTWTATLDASSYAPGTVAKLKLTAVDASGNAAASGTIAIGGITSNLASQGLPNATAANLVEGTKTLTIYAPAVSGTWVVQVVDGAGVKYTATATVTGGSSETAANAAADAALEAIDAANAATDAANLAAEAADAATMAAQDAKDAADAATAAVEKLAQDVATMIDALKAQLATLANVVAKIAKKVKA